MDKLEIYEQTLAQLAKEGNQSAALALTLGAAAHRSVQISDQARRDMLTEAQNVSSALDRAIMHNSIKWSRSTDDAIIAARNHLMRIMSILATR